MSFPGAFNLPRPDQRRTPEILAAERRQAGAIGGLVRDVGMTTPHYAAGMIAEALPQSRGGRPDWFAETRKRMPEADWPLIAARLATGDANDEDYSNIGAAMQAFGEGSEARMLEMPGGQWAQDTYEGSRDRAVEAGVPEPLIFGSEMVTPGPPVGKLIKGVKAAGALAGKLASTGADPGALMAVINAWTAGPHRWSLNPELNRLTTRSDKIGTGQGSQVIAHGNYSGEVRDVAETYQGPGGELYAVQHDVNKEDLLDWDRPLDQDPAILALLESSDDPDIARALEKVREPRPPVSGATEYPPVATDPEGASRFYDALVKEKQGAAVDELVKGGRARGQFEDDRITVVEAGEKAAELASNALRDAGIPGTRYLDQQSRLPTLHQQDGSRISSQDRGFGGTGKRRPGESKAEYDDRHWADTTSFVRASTALNEERKIAGGGPLTPDVYEAARARVREMGASDPVLADDAIARLDALEDAGADFQEGTSNYVMFQDDLTYVDRDRMPDERLLEGLTEEQIGAPWRTTPIRTFKDFGGGDTVGAVMDDAETVGLREWDQGIADWNKSQGKDFGAQDVLQGDPTAARGADHYHASPVCKNFSNAKTADCNWEFDRDSARAVSETIEQSLPPAITIENVPKYLGTEYLDEITGTMTEAGYTWDVIIVDAAHFGAASNRRRIIVRAVREGELPDLPPGVVQADDSGRVFKTVQDPERRGDWFPAIAAVLEDAPDDVMRGKGAGVANKELEAIQERIEMFERTGGKHGLDPDQPIITMGGRTASRNPGQPAPTMTASTGAVVRVIVPKQGITLPDGRVILKGGGIKRLDSRMMARLMGIPDDVPVPDDWNLAKTILGNGVHAETTRNIIQPVAEAGRRMRKGPN